MDVLCICFTASTVQYVCKRKKKKKIVWYVFDEYPLQVVVSLQLMTVEMPPLGPSNSYPHKEEEDEKKNNSLYT